MLWEILARKTPYSYDKLNSYQISILLKEISTDGKRPDIEQVEKGTPKELVELMQKCWHKDLEERPSFEEICNTIDKIIEISIV